MKVEPASLKVNHKIDEDLFTISPSRALRIRDIDQLNALEEAAAKERMERIVGKVPPGSSASLWSTPLS